MTEVPFGRIRPTGDEISSLRALARILDGVDPSPAQYRGYDADEVVELPIRRGEFDMLNRILFHADPVLPHVAVIRETMIEWERRLNAVTRGEDVDEVLAASKIRGAVEFEQSWAEKLSLDERAPANTRRTSKQLPFDV